MRKAKENLYPCFQCETENDIFAKKCSSCEVKNPSKKTTPHRFGQVFSFSLFALIAFLIWGGGNGKASDTTYSQVAKKQTRVDGFHCLSNLDGSHRIFKNDVKSRLKVPTSFKHVETQVWPVDEYGYHKIRMEYLAVNGYGVKVRKVAIGNFFFQNCRHTITLEDNT